MQNLRLIFSVFIHSPGEMTTCDACYTNVHCSFWDSVTL